jgi:hypothetical protein
MVDLLRARARFKIKMMNLGYSIRRLAQRERMALRRFAEARPTLEIARL